MRLTMKQRQAVAAVTGQRYRNGSKKVKQQILNEFCETTGYCRGYARNPSAANSSCAGVHITFTRTRPYRKNDNCYVEQKNYSVVRQTVGYEATNQRWSRFLHEAIGS